VKNLPSVAIVILNWNGVAHLQKFLPSVLKTTYTNHSTWVIDNGSTDNSIDFLEKTYADTIKIVRLTENTGYAGGYQLGLKNINADYYVLLNSDVETPADWLTNLMEFVETKPECTAVQPKILSYAQPTHFEYAGAAGGLIDALGYPYCHARAFATTHPDTGQHNQPQPIFWASGACMLVQAKAFWSVGGLDTHFFAHMEEIDLCWRLQNAGHQIWYCPTAQIYHVGGGTLQYGSPRKTFLNFRNSLITIFKNTPMWQATLLIAIRTIALDPIAALQMLLSGEKNHAKAILQAHIDFRKNIRQHLQNRRQIPHKKSLWTMQGVALKSIVFEYFVLKKRDF
jgi:GT2 family glycosyltransferase